MSLLSLEELIQQERWEEAERKLNKLPWTRRSNEIYAGFKHACRIHSRVPCLFFRELAMMLSDLSCLQASGLTSVPVVALKDTLKCVYNDGPSTTSGLRPLISFCVQEMWNAYFSSRGAKDMFAELMNVSSLEDLDAFPDLKSTWQKTEVYLAVMVGRDLDNDPSAERGWLVVHAIAQSRKIPGFLICLALTMYPEQIRTRDGRGRLPLHYAAEEGHAPWMHHGVPFTGVLQEANEHMTPYIIRRFPEGSRFADNDGRLPLSLALEGNCDSSESSVIIDLLVNAAPDALVARDPKTHFWPFQLAVSSGQAVHSIYSLLRANPVVIMYVKSRGRTQTRDKNDDWLGCCDSQQESTAL